jgi:hypothetical protein
LTVAGTLTDDDFRYIRANMAETLQEADMSNASNTVIGSWDFSGCAALTSVIIPASVTKIGSWNIDRDTGAFSISIPDDDSMKFDNVGAAFDSCTGLTAITVHPDNPYYTSEDGVLFNKNMTLLIGYPNGRQGDYIIPASVTKIMRGAFWGCSGLTSITFPASITEISHTFFDGTGLTAIAVHPDNFIYTSEDGVLFNKDKTELIVYPERRQGGYVIPASVTKIGAGAFYGCVGLTSVFIPAPVTKIGVAAFYNCTALTSVIIRAEIRKIGRAAFYSCTALTSIVIPDSVVKIGAGAFEDCTGLTSVTISDSITKIKHETFLNCSGLVSVTIPDSVVEIDDSAFGECTGLTSVTIPDSVERIGNGAFCGSGIKSITVPRSVVEIGELFFRYCPDLESISIHPGNRYYASENGVLFSKDMTRLLQYPQGRQGAYVIPDSVIEIGDFAFNDCTGLTSLTIPRSVRFLGDEVFEGCTGLTSVIIDEWVEDIIDEYTFDGCPVSITVMPDEPVVKAKRK